MTYFLKILDRERFLCLYFTSGLLTWAPGQGVQGGKQGGVRREEDGGRESGSEGGWAEWGEEGSNGM